MTKNLMQNIIQFVFKYIWMFCALLIALELISVTYTAGILIEQTSVRTMQAVSGEISGRVDGVFRLLKGLSNDPQFADTSVPLFERAVRTRPYKDSYNLFMVAITDEEVNVASSNTAEGTKEYKNLAYRDYMQRLYATGVPEITDAFLAGTDNKTLNYTIAVPIFKGEVVAGSVFGSIYFEDIEEIVSRGGKDAGRDLFLYGTERTAMAASQPGVFGKKYAELAANTYFLNCSLETIESRMREGSPGSCWEWGPDGLAYLSYQRVAPTGWTLLHRANFGTVVNMLLPGLLIKIGFYILICVSIYLLGRKYLTSRLTQVNHLVNRMVDMQKELFHSEQPDYDNLLELTQKGLTDQLTGLVTRAVLFEKMEKLIEAPGAYGAVIFLDLDDLKRINDNFGHEGGDCALLRFAKVLNEYEQKCNGIAARYGGDEFILVCDGLTERNAIDLAQNLCKELNIAVSTGNNTFMIHASLGISFYPHHGTRAEELICKADLALYSAKQNGKNQCAFYGEDSAL